MRLIALVLACLLAAPIARAADVPISDAASFTTAAKAYLCGDRFLMAPGDYAVARWSSKDCPGAAGLTILSADPTKRAAFTGGMIMDQARSVIFKGVDFRGSSAVAHIFRPYAGRDVTFDDVDVMGTIPTPTSRQGQGFNVPNVSNFTIINSRIHDVSDGVVLANTINAKIINTDFTDIGNDGLKFSGVQGLDIDAAHFFRFWPSPNAHPDAIQGFGTGTTQASRNVLIRNTLIEIPFEGPFVQGVFIGPENGTPMEDVTVEGVTTLNVHYHAVSLATINRLSLSGVTTLYQEHPPSPTGQTYKPWIQAKNSTGALSASASMSFITDGSTLVQSNNRTIPYATAEQIAAARTAWLTKFRPTTPPTPEPSPPACDCAALKAQVAALTATNADLVSQLSAKDAQIAAAAKQIDSLNAALTAANSKISAATAVLTAP